MTRPLLKNAICFFRTLAIIQVSMPNLWNYPTIMFCRLFPDCQIRIPVHHLSLDCLFIHLIHDLILGRSGCFRFYVSHGTVHTWFLVTFQIIWSRIDFVTRRTSIHSLPRHHYIIWNKRLFICNVLQQIITVNGCGFLYTGLSCVRMVLIIDWLGALRCDLIGSCF